ncbi:MAG: DUF805 domain-containing protein, partial [Pseudomonadota bacterium]
MNGALRFLFSPFGRISRADIWLKFFLPYVGLSILFSFVDALVFGYDLDSLTLFSDILGLFYLWPSFACPIKRFHDRGMTGWWVLAVNVVIIAGALLIGFGIGFDLLMSFFFETDVPVIQDANTPMIVLGALVAAAGVLFGF